MCFLSAAHKAWKTQLAATATLSLQQCSWQSGPAQNPQQAAMRSAHCCWQHMRRTIAAGVLQPGAGRVRLHWLHPLCKGRGPVAGAAEAAQVGPLEVPRHAQVRSSSQHTCLHMMPSHTEAVMGCACMWPASTGLCDLLMLTRSHVAFMQTFTGPTWVIITHRARLHPAASMQCNEP